MADPVPDVAADSAIRVAMRPGATVEQWHAGMDELSRLVAQAETAANAPGLSAAALLVTRAAEARAVAAEAERDAAFKDAKHYSAMLDGLLATALDRAEAAEAEAATLREALSDAVTWIENYPLNSGLEYDAGWNLLLVSARAALAAAGRKDNQ